MDSLGKQAAPKIIDFCCPHICCLLATVGIQEIRESAASGSNMRSLFATNYEDEISEGAIESPRQKEEIKLQVGDKVTLRVGEDKLREMQLKYGGVTAGIIKVQFESFHFFHFPPCLLVLPLFQCNGI